MTAGSHTGARRSPPAAVSRDGSKTSRVPKGKTNFCRNRNSRHHRDRRHASTALTARCDLLCRLVLAHAAVAHSPTGSAAPERSRRAAGGDRRPGHRRRHAVPASGRHALLPRCSAPAASSWPRPGIKPWLRTVLADSGYVSEQNFAPRQRRRLLAGALGDLCHRCTSWWDSPGSGLR
jgi:hypothetical protein